MRDPNRITHFCTLLAGAWKRVPDWRFGQFIINFMRWLGHDPWFYEDSELFKLLDEYMDTITDKKEG